MFMKRKEDYMANYKIIVVGAKGVGKSEIVRQYVNLAFNTQYHPTESFLSYNKIVRLDSGNGKDILPTFVRINIIDSYSIIAYTDFRFPIDHELLLAKPEKLTGQTAIAATKMREEFEKLFRHLELGDLKKEAYGIIFVYESGNQKSFEIVFPSKITCTG